MVVLIVTVAVIANGLLSLPVGMLLLQVLFAFGTKNSLQTPGPARAKRGAFAVLVPAHNEGPNLISTLSDIRRQLADGDRVVVVVDNCTDDTKSVALGEGAEVVERNDPSRRGKGYALECGVEFLRQAPADTVIIVDADCRLADRALEFLAATSQSSSRPVQGLYLMQAADRASPKMLVAEFAWVLKNLVRPLGLKALGGACHLMGSGMAFPWRMISAAELGTNHIVEDLKLGVELAARGSAPLFCPSARIFSVFPTSQAAAMGQRKRWEQGHLAFALTQGRKLLPTAIAGKNRDLLGLLADLYIPPLSLLLAGLTFVFVFTCLAAWITGCAALLWLSAANFAALLASLAVAWLVFGRDTLPAKAIPSVTAYLLQKVPVYVRIWRDRKNMQWVRTERDGFNV